MGVKRKSVGDNLRSIMIGAMGGEHQQAALKAAAFSNVTALRSEQAVDPPGVQGVSPPRSTPAYPSPQSNTSSQQLNPAPEPSTWIQLAYSGAQQLNPAPQQVAPAADFNMSIQQFIPAPQPETTVLVAKTPTLRTAAQKTAYAFFNANPDLVATYDILSEKLAIPKGTLRDVIGKLEALGLISKKPYIVPGQGRGLRIRFVGAGAVPGNCRVEVMDRGDGKDTLDRKKEKTSIYLENAGGERPAQALRMRLLGLSEERLRDNWPHLAAVGFGPSQLVQIVENLDFLGKSLDRLITGLDHAEFALERGGGALRDAKGAAIRSPLNYVFTALRRDGYFPRPADYVSPLELAERDAKEEASRLAMARKEREEAEFAGWLAGLESAERRSILAGKPGGPDEPFLRNYWQRKVKG